MWRMAVCFVALNLASGTALAQKGGGGQIDSGKLTAIDTAKGTISVSVETTKAGTVIKEYAIPEATKVVLVVGDRKTELTGKDRLKNDRLKEGIGVKVVSDSGGKITTVEFSPSDK